MDRIEKFGLLKEIYYGTIASGSAYFGVKWLYEGEYSLGLLAGIISVLSFFNTYAIHNVVEKYRRGEISKEEAERILYRRK